jgi:hypothetical protein
MAKTAPFFRQQFFDGNGDPLSNGFLYTYEAGTTTAKATYTDSSETISNTNPIELDANGVADIWLGNGAYKFVLKDSSNSTVQTVDNILGDSTIGFNGSVSEISSNLALTTDYQNALIAGSATLNLTLLSASSAGEGFVFTVLNIGSGTITIDPDSAETINGASTLELSANEWAIVTCDGTNWRALSNTGTKNNLSASAAPTVNDDTDDGYAPGSIWVDTTGDEAYRCVDATAGAAVWLNTTLTIDDLGAVVTKGADTDFTTPTDDNVPTTLAVKNEIDAKTSNLQTAVTLTTQTEVDFSSIPAGVEEIKVFIVNGSLSGTSDIMVQIGDSGGFETSGYVGNVSNDSGSSTSYTNGFHLTQNITSSPDVVQISATLNLVDASTNTWVIHGGYARTDNSHTGETIGSKSLSGTLDSIKITAVNGTDQLDAGVLNVRY